MGVKESHYFARRWSSAPSDVCDIGITELSPDDARTNAALLSADHDVWRRIVDSLASRVVLLDEAGTIVAVNDAWRRFGKDTGAGFGSVGSAYVEVPQQLVGQGSGLPPWVSVSLSGAGQLLGLPSAALGGALTPRAIIEALARDSTGQADVLAEQTIGGVPTMHYREAGRQFGSGYAIDVWVDSATGLLRRIALIPAGASKSAGAGAGSGATVQIDFTAYGPQKVTAPPPASQVGSLAAALQKFGI